MDCPSCALAEAQVDRLTSALDLEARARQQMAEGLAQAHAEIARLEGLLHRYQGMASRLAKLEEAAGER